MAWPGADQLGGRGQDTELVGPRGVGGLGVPGGA